MRPQPHRPGLSPARLPLAVRRWSTCTSTAPTGAEPHRPPAHPTHRGGQPCSSTAPTGA